MTVAISFIPPIFTDEYDGYKMRTLVNELERTLAELTRGVDVIDIIDNEINDLTAAVTWANVPSANITQGSVTQHEAALSIASSQLTGLQLTDNSDVTTAAVTSRFALMADGAAYVGRAIVEADVSDLQAYLTSFTEVNDLTAAVTWANVPNANITQGSVTQHEAALTILESQITDGSILARVAGTETISGQWDFTRSRGAPAQYAISVVAAAPFQEFDNTGAGTDEGSWAWGALASSFVFRTTTDNDTTGTTWLTVNRTAEVVDNATFGVPILATSYGGIPEADLVNKQAAEIISAEWDFTTNPKIDAAGIDTGTFAAARVATHTGDVTGQTALTLAVAAITGKTALGSGLASTDELLLSDAGVIKRMDVSVIEAYMQANLSFGGGTVISAEKGTSESTDTDTTLSDDSELTVALTAGTWYITGTVFFFANITAGMGFKWKLNYPGSISRSRFAVVGDVNGSAFVREFFNTEEITHTTITLSTGPFNFLNFSGIIVTTGSDTLAFQWAQNTSNANGLTVNNASSLIATKLA